VSLYYTHTLIPTLVDYTAQPLHVRDFFLALCKLGAAPAAAQFCLTKPDGKVRKGKDPWTGESISIPSRERTTFAGAETSPSWLIDVNDYDVTMSGTGSVDFPLLEFEHKSSYYLDVHCCRRPAIVSTSDCHDCSRKSKTPAFGEPCGIEHRMGIYNNPSTMERIEVPNAGCARFWIEFSFGKFLFPKIDKTLDLLPRSVVELAEQAFQIDLVQGCHWG